MPSTLATLPPGPKVQAPQVRNAARYLRGAHSSVAGLFDSVQTIAAVRRTANATTVGRLNRQEVDLLRSAIVFTSSGLDAAMTVLVSDAARHLIRCGKSTGAKAQFDLYLKNEMSAAAPVPQGLRDAVIHDEAATKILDHYVRERTKASYQGSGDLEKRVRNVLGIASTRISTGTLQSLDPFFKARNRIAHDLDYEDTTNPKATKRTERRVDDVVALCDGVFTFCSDIIHATADVIVAAR
jgi:hypothetical protein